LNKAIFLQQLAHQFERDPFVSPGLDQHIKNFALGVDGTPDYWLRVFPTEETYLQALVIANLLLLPPDPV
jgi:hypothetical protein